MESDSGRGLRNAPVTNQAHLEETSLQITGSWPPAKEIYRMKYKPFPEHILSRFGTVEY